MPKTDQRASERTILVAPGSNEISKALGTTGFDLVTWPQLQIQTPDTFALLDEAIENLFGYDWLIFVNADAARFFLQRFDQQGRDVSNLDTLRVCAVGETTAAALDQSQVHVDIVATKMPADAVIESITPYVGGRESLQRLNFLIPQAAIGRGYLKDDLENAEARADVVVAYRTVATPEMTQLIALQSMLLTRSIDAVVFESYEAVTEFARLFDTNDLGRLLQSIPVLAVGPQTSAAAESFGVSPMTSSTEAMAQTLVKHFDG